MNLEIKVKYLDKNMPKLGFVDGDKSDWIDLMCMDDIKIAKDEFQLINLGVIIKVPDGYESYVIPRSSTFKKYGLLQANSFGIIDGSYAGEADVWHGPVLATRDVEIPKYTRLFQFRIAKQMPKIKLTEVERMDGPSRGSFGSTGD